MKNRWFSLLLTILLFAACGKVSKIDGYGHAELFSLQKNERGEVVLAEILSGGEIWRYRFCPREEGCAVLGDREFRVAVPLRRTAVCTTTVLALTEAVGVENAVVGVDGDYTTIKSFRERISRKEIPLLAEGMKLDREKLTALKPEAVFFSPAGGDWEEAEKIISAGAVPVPIEDWRETTPLGRAQWAELEAAFFGKSIEAAALFGEIESRYEDIKAKISLRSRRPEVMFNLPANGQWRMPSGSSFSATAAREGGCFYLAPETAAETVLFDLEGVFARFSSASLWVLHSGSFQSRAEFENAALSALGDSRLDGFPPLKTARVAVNDRLTDERGFNGFYDYSPLRPDWLLEDWAAMTGGGEPTHFYRILK